MLVRSGDLIPVQAEAAQIPWTRRRSVMLNYLLRGPVTFETYVYDTNVGDVSQLASYFNPERWSVVDLNVKFGIQPQDNLPTQLLLPPPQQPAGGDSETDPPSSPFAAPSTDSTLAGGDRTTQQSSLVPKLLIYPLHPRGEMDEQRSKSPNAATNEVNYLQPPPPFKVEEEEMETMPETDQMEFTCDFKHPPPPLLPLFIKNHGRCNDNDLGLSVSAFQQAMQQYSVFPEHPSPSSLSFCAPVNLVNLCHQFDEVTMLQAMFYGEGLSSSSPWAQQQQETKSLSWEQQMLQSQQTIRQMQTQNLHQEDTSLDVTLDSYLPQNLQWILQTCNSSSILETSV